MKTTREELLDFGEEAVRSTGYGAFSYATLANRAGIRKASIHHHFPAKADLGLALIARYAERLEEGIDAILAGAATGGDALLAIVDLYRSALDGGERMCLCSALAGDSAVMSDPMRGALASANRMVADRFETVIARGQADGTIALQVSPADAAPALLAQLQGAQLLARAEGVTEPFDRATATVRKSVVGKTGS